MTSEADAEKLASLEYCHLKSKIENLDKSIETSSKTQYYYINENNQTERYEIDCEGFKNLNITSIKLLQHDSNKYTYYKKLEFFEHATDKKRWTEFRNN
ncbi:MAG: hypothetical protein WC707_02965 [Candidatus Babeliaceae bacterium]|jgi:hypothetical protein